MYKVCSPLRGGRCSSLRGTALNTNREAVHCTLEELWVTPLEGRAQLFRRTTHSTLTGLCTAPLDGGSRRLKAFAIDVLSELPPISGEMNKAIDRKVSLPFTPYILYIDLTFFLNLTASDKSVCVVDVILFWHHTTI